MGNVLVPAIPSRPAVVPAGVTRICVAGYGLSHNTGRAQKLAALIAQKYGTEYETWFYFSTLGYAAFLEAFLPELPSSEQAKQGTTDFGKTIGQHSSAPLVWLETTTTTTTTTTAGGGDNTAKKQYTALGGRDMFCLWAKDKFANDADIQALLTPPGLADVWFDNRTPGGTYTKE